MNRITKRYEDGMAYCNLDLVSRLNENECVGLPISKLADFEDDTERKDQGCEYCNGSKNFGDADGGTIRITRYGYLEFDNSSEEYASGCSDYIKYCPMCGKEL